MDNREQIRIVLATAIAYEIEAQHLYSRMRDAAGDVGTKQTLKGLYEDEVRHERLIREIYDDQLGEEAGVILRSTGRSAGVPTHGIDAREALEIALGKEATARAYYGRAAGEAHTPELRDLLLMLEQEEDGHYTLISQELKARAGLPWEPIELDSWVRE